MYCQNCGKPNDENSAFCSNCGKSLTATQKTPVTTYVPNYLAQAILVTIFCCLPFGIVAIVYAAQVNGKLRAGLVSEAIEASNSAKTWCWVSFWLGLAVGIIYFFFAFLGGLASI